MSLTEVKISGSKMATFWRQGLSAPSYHPLDQIWFCEQYRSHRTHHSQSQSPLDQLYPLPHLPEWLGRAQRVSRVEMIRHFLARTPVCKCK